MITYYKEERLMETRFMPLDPLIGPIMYPVTGSLNLRNVLPTPKCKGYYLFHATGSFIGYWDGEEWGGWVS